MTKTLLDITQEILSRMDGDEVNSISDTEESEQVARHIVSTYDAMVSNSNWFHTRRALTLVPRSDTDYPTHISLNENVKELSFINYNKVKSGETRKDYREVKWKEPDDFLRYINTRDSTASNVQVVTDDSGIELLILNDKAPEYFTSFDDENIIFDSFDSDVDTTIQSSKVQAQGFIIPTLALEDTAEPQLPPDAMVALIEEATSKAQWWVRQFQDTKSEQESKRQKRWLARKQWRTHGGIKYRDYGRQARRQRDVTFERNR